MLVPDSEYCSDSECRKGQAGVSGAPAAGQQKPGRYGLDHRALLFGSRFGRGLKVNGRGRAAAEFHSGAEVHAEAARAAIEEQNELHAEELHQKVAVLKQTTMEISREVVESSSLVDDLDVSFGKAQSLLRSTMGNLKGMVAHAGGRHMYCLSGFFVFLLLVLYFMARWAAARGGAAPAGSAAFLAPSAEAAAARSSVALPGL